MDELIARHRIACDAFAETARAVPPDRWSAPSPCTEWDARAVVEHVIGFHEFLLLRPLGVRAHRPREGPAARWDATATALFDALAADGVLDRPTELPGGGQSRPRDMLGALTTDVLVHTWDLARATGGDERLDPDAVHRMFEGMEPMDDMIRGSGQFGARVAVPDDADEQTKLIAFTGRTP